MSEPGVLDVVLLPGDRELEPGDGAWPRDLAELHQGLRAYEIDVRDRAGQPVPQHKGTVAEIVVALGSSGAIGAAMAVLQSWLNQRSTRTMAITIEQDGRKTVYEIQAEGVSQDAVRDALLAALSTPTAGSTAITGQADQ
jgi:hypothetical protein